MHKQAIKKSKPTGKKNLKYHKEQGCDWGKMELKRLGIKEAGKWPREQAPHTKV